MDCIKITKEQLKEEMREQYSYVSYEDKHLDSFMKSNILRPTDTIEFAAYLFVDYLMSQNLADEVVL